MIAQTQQKIWNIYKQLNRSQKLYLIGCVLALNTLFWNLTPFNDLFKTSLGSVENYRELIKLAHN